MCGGTLRSPSGFINSPGYPLAYLPSLECDWLIKATNGNTLTLTITSLELEDSEDCSADSLTIHDGRSRDTKVLDKVCGTVSIKRFHSTGQYLHLVFRSNERVQWKGFSIQYTAGISVTLFEAKYFLLLLGSCAKKIMMHNCN